MSKVPSNARPTEEAQVDNVDKDPGEDENPRENKGKSPEGKSARGSGDEEESALTPEDIEAIKNMKLSERFDKLDRDYFLYLSLIYSTMKNTQFSPTEADIAWAWVQKIISMPASTMEAKREKNIYFLYLLFQLKENRLKGIFSQKPVQGSLNKAAEAFYGVKSPQKDKLYECKFLEPDATLAHKSSDGRTYIASKVLEGNSGVCCYVAVSTGLKDPVWITPCGEQADVSPREDLPVTAIKKCKDSVYFKKTEAQGGKTELETGRKSYDERFQLTSFHHEIVDRVNQEMRRLLCDGSEEVRDPFLVQLIRKMKNDVAKHGECLDDPPIDILRRIREKSVRIIKEAEDREREIEVLSDNLDGEDANHKLVDLSGNLALDPEDDVWLAAIREEPTAEVIQVLKKQYPQCLIEALLTLLERQRQVIIEQEKRNFEELIFALKSELEENVQPWRKELQELKEEWTNVIKVIRDIEKARGDLTEENETVETPLDAKKQTVASRNLDEALENYENARGFYLSAERKMNSLQCRIEEAQKRYLASKKDLEMETANWSATICRLRNDLQMQEMLIKDLQDHA